jgi:hypothetical protein
MDKYNIDTRKGDTWDGLAMNILVNGAPLNLTGALVSLEARVNGSSTVSLLLTQASGITIVSPATSGYLSINPIIFPMDSGVYIYDMSITIGTRVKTYLQGLISIDSDAHYAG